jgi:predicted DNA binding CopG/RHH family protein
VGGVASTQFIGDTTPLESVEKGEWKSVQGAKEKIKKYQEYAKATFRKDKRVNIRISEKDLVGLQKKAVEEGLPYQTLISSILHKFISGRLIEKKS